MEYKVTIDKFEGPLDLLLHLIKQSDIDIYDIKIEVITKQYMDYITAMEQMNLNIASEYLVMASELIEMKSSSLLPKKNSDVEDEYETDPREKLIERLLEYQKYKEMAPLFHDMEEARKQVFTKSPSNLKEFQIEGVNIVNDDINVDALVVAFEEFLKRKQMEKPLHTKITKKEYSVNERSNQIKNILNIKKKVSFVELFDINSKDYIVVTFLAILNLARKNELIIKQNNNFEDILLEVI